MRNLIIKLSCNILNYYLEKKLSKNLADARSNNITFNKQLLLKEIKSILINKGF